MIVAPDSRPLTIEVVPETCWVSNVGEIISPAACERLRRQVVRAAGYRCEICRQPAGTLWCHAIWEFDDDEHVQRLTCLVALCTACAEVKNLAHAADEPRWRELLAHLAEVNGWSADASERYRAAAFREWRERSRHGWSLDLEALRDYGFDPEALLHGSGHRSTK